MPHAERIVRTLLAPRKAAEPLILPQCGELAQTTGNQLMGIRLVTDIKDDFIGGAVEYRMNRQDNLNSA